MFMLTVKMSLQIFIVIIWPKCQLCMAWAKILYLIKFSSVQEHVHSVDTMDKIKEVTSFYILYKGLAVP